mmetsp:Transcript_549/g.1554  ORF Transcript_549/g.1554 Transcript_549/m.1554 type:complete len:256 (-) Transcript_549:559-1326(-)
MVSAHLPRRRGRVCAAGRDRRQAAHGHLPPPGDSLRPGKVDGRAAPLWPLRPREWRVAGPALRAVQLSATRVVVVRAARALGGLRGRYALSRGRARRSPLRELPRGRFPLPPPCQADIRLAVAMPAEAVGFCGRRAPRRGLAAVYVCGLLQQVLPQWVGGEKRLERRGAAACAPARLARARAMEVPCSVRGRAQLRSWRSDHHRGRGAGRGALVPGPHWQPHRAHPLQLRCGRERAAAAMMRRYLAARVDRVPPV